MDYRRMGSVYSGLVEVVSSGLELWTGSVVCVCLVYKVSVPELIPE